MSTGRSVNFNYRISMVSDSNESRRMTYHMRRDVMVGQISSIATLPWFFFLVPLMMKTCSLSFSILTSFASSIIAPHPQLTWSIAFNNARNLKEIKKGPSQKVPKTSQFIQRDYLVYVPNTLLCKIVPFDGDVVPSFSKANRNSTRNKEERYLELFLWSKNLK